MSHDTKTAREEIEPGVEVTGEHIQENGVSLLVPVRLVHVWSTSGKYEATRRI